MRVSCSIILICTLLLACSTPRQTTTVVPVGVSDNDSAFMQCDRTISVISKNEFVVTLTVISSKLNGNARINDHIPAGCKVKSIDSESGLFDYNENTVQIVWVDYPQKNELKVSYLVIVDSTVAGIEDIYGDIEINDLKCEIPSATLAFDEHSIMVQDVTDLDINAWSNITEQRELLLGEWQLTKIKGEGTIKYGDDDRYILKFRNDNHIQFNTNVNSCTAKFSLNSDENITIVVSTCSEQCCDEAPLTYPYGLNTVTYYNVSKNKLILSSENYQYEFERN